ncbi:hypothetical protein GLOIN_2v988879 [Rhizophagus irregularis DAOM 181602=DAOM 197198]|uniref:Uncharacterized protein n=1 Tax=Rhizophagus irregularis (strain DAOM 181602 / DAOM 197198 / MUCL 43194) TaxID=747089 RepID=A0A2P4NXE1_RHIID|nr:hypothetical protein GLOIN_2v988879 [Rhizophagus irregularis DAOM 181602=DAOM 197198]POG57783.1 hypothetical protein GLOIN_2v988879 [Rhizophagus irregularis DAOM 181602=DAOM 197198]GET60697.1 hypothetical protein GLOIN_2v988879 [Rhizophagus irregularis DAOM 181602=DAOM 197198]|eukprot:XP_025164649.1 hypothetical protein GLOIN_2v988879 [Rhizophagus irregularis DAOM 181602=DAOM 197198]
MNQNENLTLILDTEEQIQELKMLSHHEKLFYLFYLLFQDSNTLFHIRNFTVTISFVTKFTFSLVLETSLFLLFFCSYRRVLIGEIGDDLSFFKTSCYWTDYFLESLNV